MTTKRRDDGEARMVRWVARLGQLAASRRRLHAALASIEEACGSLRERVARGEVSAALVWIEQIEAHRRSAAAALEDLGI